MQLADPYPRQLFNDVSPQAATADDGDTFLLEKLLLLSGDAVQISTKIFHKAMHDHIRAEVSRQKVPILGLFLIMAAS